MASPRWTSVPSPTTSPRRIPTSSTRGGARRRRQQPGALTTSRADPDGAAKAIAAQIGLTPEAVAGQLKQGVYLTPDEVASPEWLRAERPAGQNTDNPLKRS